MQFSEALRALSGHPGAIILYVARFASYKSRYGGNHDEADKAERQKEGKHRPIKSHPKHPGAGCQWNYPARENNPDVPTKDSFEFLSVSPFKKPGRYLPISARTPRRIEMVAPGTNEIPEQENGQTTIDEVQHGKNRPNLPY